MAYFAPTALNDALAMIGSEDVNIIAGGTDVFPAQGQAPLQKAQISLEVCDAK